MPQNLDQTIALLERFPASVNVLLRGLPDAWTRGDEGEKTWTPFDVVGHLVNLERSQWIPRIQHLLDKGTSEPFAPVDRFAQLEANTAIPLETLLDDLVALRARNVADLRALNLQSADFEKLGRHPALGPVTLSNVLATWVAHDLTHLHQLSRILASQYREAVGPWSAYLGVLKCAGHSD